MTEAMASPVRKRPAATIPSTNGSSGTDMVSDSSLPSSTRLPLPGKIMALPAWLRNPFERFLRLKQRNWPAKTVQRATRQLCGRLFQMMDFFIQQHGWQSWEQLSLRWLEDYIDLQLQQGLSPATINWDLINFRVFCRFLIDEGYPAPDSILKLKLLDTPRRLPRPLSNDQVRRLEVYLQTAFEAAKNDYLRQLTLRDLACFYLLWHCGLRISEVCSLLVNEVDLEGRKLFIRNSKERKDRVVYASDTTIAVLSQYLAIRRHPEETHLFTSQRGALTPSGLQYRIRHYRQECGVPVTAQRLRHTFATQMLAAGTPVTSLQHYLGHERLDTTMVYAEVSDPMLQQDYYQAISTLDPASAQYLLDPSHKNQLRQLLAELAAQPLDQTRQQKILEKMQQLLDSPD